jgi:hypothetical protein
VSLSTDEDRARFEAAMAAHEAAHREELLRLRTLSTGERGRQLEAACEDAAEILRSRRAMGLADPQPAPWPASTWEFLRKDALNVRQRSGT